MKKTIFLFLFFFCLVHIPANAKTPYQIGAYYFAMWNPNDVRSLRSLDYLTNKGCQDTYGRSNDQWCGVRDFFNGKTQGWNDDFSHLKPSIDYYDDSKPETYEKHIKQATQNGLSYFAFYYYWDSVQHQEALRSSMNAFLKAKNKNDIKFIFSFYVPIEVATSEFTGITSNIVNKYFTQPNYMKTRDDRPIFVLGSVGKLGDVPGKAATELFIATLKNTTLAKVGKDPYIIFSNKGVSPDVDPPDGYTCLSNYTDTLYDPEASVGSYDRYVNVAPKHDTEGKPYLTCSMANLDERPRTGIIPWLPRDKVRYTLNFTSENFRAALIKEKQFMDGRDDELSNMLTIYAWNEWHEGGIIEPNARDGAKLLNIISDVFDLPKGTDPCRITGKCDAVLGDANIDTKIDLYDFYLWKKEYSGKLSTKKADFNQDNLINLADFNIWRVSYLKQN